MVLVSIKTTPNKPPSKITTPHNRNKPNISSQPKIVSSKITPLLRTCLFLAISQFLQFLPYALYTLSILGARDFSCVFSGFGQVLPKNGITSLGSVFINKQFAIIPLRTFKCKKRMFSSSADVHHMPKYPVHL